MRLFCLTIALLFLSDMAMAKPFTYSETEHFEKPSVTTTLLMEQKLSAVGFTALDQSGLGKIPILNMDQVFQKEKQTIFFKQGLKPSNKLGIQKIAGGYVYHGVTDTEVHYALFFDGFKKAEVAALLKRTHQSMYSEKEKTFAINFTLIPSACASEVGSCEPPSPLTQLKEIAQSTTAYATAMNISSIAGSCAVSALQAAKDAPEDLKNSIVGAWNFTKSLLHEPEKLWHTTKKVYNEIKDLITNFEPRMKQFLESMRNLDPEIAAEIICSTISSIVVQSVIGGGLAKAAIMVTRTFLSLDKVRGALTVLSQLKTRGNPGSSALTSRIIACVR